MSDAPLKTCSRCSAELPDTGEHFTEHRRKSGRVYRDSFCRSCACTAQRERYRRTMQDDRLRAYEKARRRVYDQRWQRENPDKVRERQRRYYRAKVSTPEGRAQVNEAQRMAYRLRAQREGREVRAIAVKDPKTGKRAPLRQTRNWLDPEPVREFIEKVGGIENAAPRDVMLQRALHRVVSGESQHVDLHVVDRLLLINNMIFPDIYDPNNYPEVYAA